MSNNPYDPTEYYRDLSKWLSDAPIQIIFAIASAFRTSGVVLAAELFRKYPDIQIHVVALERDFWLTEIGEAITNEMAIMNKITVTAFTYARASRDAKITPPKETHHITEFSIEPYEKFDEADILNQWSHIDSLSMLSAMCHSNLRHIEFVQGLAQDILNSPDVGEVIRTLGQEKIYLKDTADGIWESISVLNAATNLGLAYVEAFMRGEIKPANQDHW